MWKRIIEIDILRGIAAISLIIAHSIISTPVDLSQVMWCNQLNKIIAVYDMPLFFLVAGFVFQCVDYRTYMIRRLKRIGVPYIFFGLSSVILHIIGGRFLAGGESLLYGLKRLLLYGGHFWFLYTMLIIYAVYPFIYKMCKNKTIHVAIFIVLLLIRFVIPDIELFTLHRVFHY